MGDDKTIKIYKYGMRRINIQILIKRIVKYKNIRKGKRKRKTQKQEKAGKEYKSKRSREK